MSRDVVVLAYHGVRERPATRLEVAVHSFERQMRSLLDRGYRPATFTEAVTKSRTRVLAVTFDDGDRAILDHGVAVLERLGMIGTLFVVTSTVGKPGLVTWSDVGALSAAGWEIGSHGVTHSDLTTLGDAALGVELASSREAIEDALGSACRSIAYPFGRVNERVVAAAQHAGYAAGATVAGVSSLSPSPLSWPRVGISPGDGAISFVLKTSRLVRHVRSTPRWRHVSLLGQSIMRARR